MPEQSEIYVAVEYNRYHLWDGLSDLDWTGGDSLSDGLVTPLPLDADLVRGAVVNTGMDFGPLPVTVVVHEQSPKPASTGMVVSEFDVVPASTDLLVTGFENRVFATLASGTPGDRWRVRLTAEHRDDALEPPEYDRNATKERHRIDLWRVSTPTPWMPVRYVDSTAKGFRQGMPTELPVEDPVALVQTSVDEEQVIEPRTSVELRWTGLNVPPGMAPAQYALTQPISGVTAWTTCEFDSLIQRRTDRGAALHCAMATVVARVESCPRCTGQACQGHHFCARHAKQLTHQA